ncbi:superoxide dismutase family protein [Sporosarcina sp. G11-34]|uniref:superoxide dismutase family protein n=1 Tax=Sporosarcina sp. G11-34 TaxID=2849605 RepID=UPI0022A9E2BD|nr:superoxide dismutase family protein [Sporosarcina sp. G11-34]MCZ2259750.1 superoxide dismutase family protein [Sporosarcina sp. G11-34]
MKKWLLLIPGFVLVFVLVACGDKNESSETDGVNDKTTEKTDGDNTSPSKEDEMVEDEDLLIVKVDLMDSSGDSIGTAELTDKDDGVQVKLNAKGLSEGTHGIHFHEVGKCEVPDFESAGGHFNPADTSHGINHEEGPHAGDLPNLEVGEDGEVNEEFLAEHVTLKGGEENSLLQEGGTALIIHAEADDGKTQPSGDSGDRIVCGVIE